VVRFAVDGFVVGAMGCFPTQSVGPKSGANAPGIFGLYLRRWLLREESPCEGTTRGYDRLTRRVVAAARLLGISAEGFKTKG